MYERAYSGPSESRNAEARHQSDYGRLPESFLILMKVNEAESSSFSG